MGDFFRDLRLLVSFSADELMAALVDLGAVVLLFVIFGLVLEISYLCGGEFNLSDLLAIRGVFLQGLMGGVFFAFVMLGLYRPFKTPLVTNITVRLLDKG